MRIKTIDDLGRVHLPKEMREALHIDYGDEVVLYVLNDKIIIQKVED